MISNYYKGWSLLFVSHSAAELPASRCVVQEAVPRPLLLQGRKFDIRVWLLLTSVDPVQLYVCQEGLVSICAEADDTNRPDELCRHLSNYAVNKSHPAYSPTANKMSLSALWRELAMQGRDPGPVWEATKAVCMDTVQCGLQRIRAAAAALPSRHSGYKLFGLDIMYDTDLKPWLLEV